MLIGLYEASWGAEIIDDVGSFEDANEYLISDHEETMNMLIEKIKISAISGHVMHNAFEKFFKCCDLEYPGNMGFASYFEPLLIAMVKKSDEADRLLAMIDQSSVERGSLPELVLLLLGKAGKASEWLETARQFYRHNNPVAEELLEYYFETDKEAFLETARELFPAEKNLWAVFLQHYITPQLDEKLFVNVFRQLTLQYREIQYYNKISSYLSETEFKELLDELYWARVFIVKILEIEQRYEEIKKLVKQDRDTREYAEMITPILTIYPEFCFNHIKNRAWKTLENARGRRIYERIVSWLQLSLKIPGFETEKLDLIKNIYSYKPNLPALRDEMRKGGLVK